MLIEHNINMLSNLLVDDSLNDMDSESEFPENVGGRVPYVKTLHLLHGRTPFWHIQWYPTRRPPRWGRDSLLHC